MTHSSALVAVAALLLVWPMMAAAQTPGSPSAPTVSVTGEGIVRRAPDQARVRIGAEGRSARPTDAQSIANTAMTAVQGKLAALGLPKDAIRTMTVSVQMEFDYVEGKQKPRGYVARNVIEVRVDDLKRLGEVLDISVAAGATTLFGLEWGLKDRAQAEREALTLAVTDAMARADAVAAGAKRTVDRLVRIEESGAVMSPVRPQMADRTMAFSASASTPVAEGEIEIRGNVVVTVALK
ncbi:MAG: SIMPL domain-containing protein [Acidobacteria bacterium]|nr:SIMPL domain-containing protein [Acidobacteriota bacterium]